MDGSRFFRKEITPLLNAPKQKRSAAIATEARLAQFTAPDDDDGLAAPYDSQPLGFGAAL
jgi:hypothetical protein